MKSRKVLMGILILAMFMVSCAPRLASTPPPSPTPELASVKDLEQEWQELIRLARKEGKVVAYTSGSAALKELTSQFSKKFGFTLEVISFSRGAELTTRILSERKAGLFIPDIYISGSNTFFGMIRPAGLAAPLEPNLILPEVLDPKLWYGEKLPWGDSEHLMFMSWAYPNTTLAINTELVKPDEIKSYRDLLVPKWKGNIILNDPTVAGTGLKGFSVLAFNMLDLDYFRQLARQEPMIIRDQRLQVDWLARGKYQVLFFPQTPPVVEYRRAGAPLAFVTPSEGTYLSRGAGNLTLIDRTPHPNAAKVLINWFLSREGQTMITQIEGSQSARLDVPTEGIDTLKIRQPGAKYFLGADTEEWLSRDQEFVKAAKDIFGDLIR